MSNVWISLNNQLSNLGNPCLYMMVRWRSVKRVLPAVYLWVVLDALYFLAFLSNPLIAHALAANAYVIGTPLAIIIGLWAGALVKSDGGGLVDAGIGGLLVGLAYGILTVALLGSVSGQVTAMAAFAALQVIASIGSAVVGNGLSK